MTTNNKKKWVSVWGSAVSINENRPESYGKNITLRYPIYSAFSGDKVRVTFDNYCGTDSITISEASILVGDTFYSLSFGGSPSYTIASGEQIVSDEIECTISAGETLHVSMYFADFVQLRSAVYLSGPLSGGSYAVGKHTSTPEFPLWDSRKTNIYYFISNVSVYTDSRNHALVCYGDSITAQDWPDYLALRCKEFSFSNTSIIRKATSGSRILREYDCITYESYGLKGEKRFLHEVPTDGADAVLIQQGINDIIHPVGEDVNPFRPMSDLPTAEELIEGLKIYISQARSLGYRVYVGTLLPIKGWRTYAPFREELRQAYNDFIRTTDLIDGCVDFDKALRDCEDPTAFKRCYDSGDHLHPSAKGYQKMALSVPAELLI